MLALQELRTEINQLIFINLGKELEINATFFIFLHIYIHYLFNLYDSIDSIYLESLVPNLSVDGFISGRCLAVHF